MSETAAADQQKPSVKSLADRFSREIPSNSVRLRKGNESSPTLPVKPSPGTIPPPKSMINAVLNDVNKDTLQADVTKIQEKSKSTDDLEHAANDVQGASAATSSVATKIRALGGMAFPIPNQPVQLRSTHDTSTRKSINFATKNDISTTQNTTNRPSTNANFTSTVDQYYRAHHPYASKYPDELSFEEGAVIKLVTKDSGEDGYWKGALNGRIGLFPNNFISPYIPNVDELSKLDPTRQHSANAAPAPVCTNKSPKNAVSDYGSKSSSPVQAGNVSSQHSPSSIIDGKVPTPLLTQPIKAARPPTKRPPSAQFLKQRKNNVDNNNLFESTVEDNEQIESHKLHTIEPSKPKDVTKSSPVVPTTITPKHELSLQSPATVQANHTNTITTSASTTTQNDLRLEFDDYKRRSEERLRQLEEQVRVLSERLDRIDKF